MLLSTKHLTETGKMFAKISNNNVRITQQHYLYDKCLISCSQLELAKKFSYSFYIKPILKVTRVKLVRNLVLLFPSRHLPAES